MSEVALKVEDGMIVLYIDGAHDTNFGFGVGLDQILERVSRKPEEGTPTTVLADAVNQLAMEMEVLVSPARIGDLRRIRENVAGLIPE